MTGPASCSSGWPSSTRGARARARGCTSPGSNAIGRAEGEQDDAGATIDPGLLDELTEQQRHVAEQLADGVGARQIANELGVSRSNVYAVRKRIARRLGVDPDDVAEVTRRLLAR